MLPIPPFRGTISTTIDKRRQMKSVRQRGAMFRTPSGCVRDSHPLSLPGRLGVLLAGKLFQLKEQALQKAPPSCSLADITE